MKCIFSKVFFQGVFFQNVFFCVPSFATSLTVPLILYFTLQNTQYLDFVFAPYKFSFKTHLTEACCFSKIHHFLFTRPTVFYTGQKKEIRFNFTAHIYISVKSNATAPLDIMFVIYKQVKTYLNNCTNITQISNLNIILEKHYLSSGIRRCQKCKTSPNQRIENDWI